MSFVPNFPPSLLQKIKDDNGDEKKKSKEDYKKMKELEEARKLAVMPAMKDEEGRDINPHIPQYIMQAPWYYGALHPTLSHQRIQDEAKREEASGRMKGTTSLNLWYRRGVSEKPKVQRYLDGACENCGSMTHKRKDCLERPRKVCGEALASNHGQLLVSYAVSSVQRGTSVSSGSTSLVAVRGAILTASEHHFA